MYTDTHVASNGTGQIHFYRGGLGNSSDSWENLSFDLITRFSHGHHVRTGGGNDIINFQDLDNVGDIVMGRIEDFDFSRDEIRIEGVLLDLNNLPANVRIVEFNGSHNDAGSQPQQWLLIETPAGGHLFYTLEGARMDMDGNGGSNEGAHERHFCLKEDLPDLSTLPDVAFIDQQNIVPDGFAPQGGITIDDVDREAADVLELINGTSDGDLIAGGLDADRIYADAGNDHVWGGSGADLVFGDDGNDSLKGGTDFDRLYGENGDDLLFGGHGDDLLSGGADNDELYGDQGEDRLYGDQGDDVLSGDDGDDRLLGDGGDDTLDGGENNDKLFGGLGNDNLLGANGDDTLVGEEDHDVLFGGDGDDYLSGGDGDDDLFGDNGDDILCGEDGDDIMLGHAGSDTLYGSVGNDLVAGGGGKDLLFGGDDDDVLLGQSGHDTLYGQSGDDELVGEVGDDYLAGGGGNDQLFGDEGDDVLLGDAGNDLLSGGAGADSATGGNGADTFEFKTGDLVDWDTLGGTLAENLGSIDVITDFDIGADHIQFDNYANVSSVADIEVWETTIDNNKYVEVNVQQTNERMLVDVDDSLSAAQFLDQASLIFL